jgi:hypothetical protein
MVAIDRCISHVAGHSQLVWRAGQYVLRDGGRDGAIWWRGGSIRKPPPDLGDPCSRYAA